MRALVKIGDKRAVPTLMKILTTSADDQDFLLNQKAALGAGRVPRSAVDPGADQGAVHDRPWHRHLPGVPAGAGAHRRARGRSADPLLQEKNADIQDMAAKLKFEEPPPVGTPGVVPHKAAILLGDLRAKKAVPALTARLHQKARGDEHRSALIALGYIASPRRSRRSSRISRTRRPTRPSAPRPPTRCTCRAIGGRCRRCWRSRSRAT